MRGSTAGLIAIIVFAGSGCGSDSTAPHHSSPIAFPAGNGQSDTISTTLPQALVVSIAVPGGELLNGHIVQFTSVVDSVTQRVEAYIEPLTSASPTTFIADSTDANGHASVVILLGTVSGTARVVIRVPEFGYSDTAKFTVKPGAAVSITASDTAAYVGAQVTLNAKVADTYGNPRTDAVTYAVVSGPGTLSGSTVTGNAIGVVQVSDKSGTLVGTTSIAVVPSGEIAASLDDGTGIISFHLDGTHYQKITTTAAGNVKWAPSGSALAFDQTGVGGDGGGTGLIADVTTNGTVTQVDNTPGDIDAWPVYSRDGTWVYYAKISGISLLWRAHPDGTTNNSVAMQNPPGVQFMSPAPDNQRLVYVVPGPGNIEVLDIATGVSTDIGLLGFATAWSPTSDQIVYLSGAGTLAVAHSDGTGSTSLSTVLYGLQFDWSPDGKWIIARSGVTGKLDLINISTLQTITLGYTGHIGSPTWH